MAATEQLQPKKSVQSETNEPNCIDAMLAGMDRWQAVAAGVLAVVTAAINIVVFLERQWQLAAVSIGLLTVGAAIYYVAHRRLALRGSGEALRYAAIAMLSLTIPTTLAVFLSVTLVPRLHEEGPIIAIARFAGPQLPAPYDDCRPSDMLADALNDVSVRFDRLTAFELPYAIDPNGRWAQTWAVSHGLLEGADVVVYGEYSLVDHAFGSNKPDRLLISPQVSSQPIVPLGWKRAPLAKWQFPQRVVPIDQLCTGTAARFVDDGRRLGLALTALELFSNQRYVGAERALAQAQERSENDRSPAGAETRRTAETSRCDAPPEVSECSGVLAFYLASLDQRTGHYGRAEREYRLAAEKLNSAAPYIDLAGLYALMCDGKNTFERFTISGRGRTIVGRRAGHARSIRKRVWRSSRSAAVSQPSATVEAAKLVRCNRT